MAVWPIPQAASVPALYAWAQSLLRQLESAVGSINSKLGTLSSAAAAPVEAPTSYVPLTFAGSPLVFVTDTPGNLILVSFAP